ncbi:hypothetical protein DPMN_063844 [Dreissena polymorpha]|uniref:Uncharacterized protein n=1 Tax=Dreissena polymorpha TaxID=45954 RepID=A0A9D4HKM6_DREPO|nr:hypothetical protein DPMN_063844 [Dreissena polymorpha]
MKENSVQVESSLNFQADSDVLQYLSGLGRIVLNTKALSVLDQVFILQGKSEYNVRITSDSEKTCHITAICVLCDDQTLVADTYNRRIKPLNHKY